VKRSAVDPARKVATVPLDLSLPSCARLDFTVTRICWELSLVFARQDIFARVPEALKPGQMGPWLDLDHVLPDSFAQRAQFCRRNALVESIQLSRRTQFSQIV